MFLPASQLLCVCVWDHLVDAVNRKIFQSRIIHQLNSRSQLLFRLGLNIQTNNRGLELLRVCVCGRGRTHFMMCFICCDLRVCMYFMDVCHLLWPACARALDGCVTSAIVCVNVAAV